MEKEMRKVTEADGVFHQLRTVENDSCASNAARGDDATIAAREHYYELRPCSSAYIYI
jgi:hypothetical protein